MTHFVSVGRILGFLCLALVLLSSLAPAQAQAAGAGDHTRQMEGVALSLEEILGLAFHGPGAKPVYTDHGGGMHSLTIELPAGLRDQLMKIAEATGAEAASLFLLQVGHSIIDPVDAESFISRVISAPDVAYSRVFAWANASGSTVVKKVTHETKCGKRKLAPSGIFTLHAHEIGVGWFTPGIGIGALGVCTQTAKVPGAFPAIVKSSFISLN